MHSCKICVYVPKSTKVAQLMFYSLIIAMNSQERSFHLLFPCFQWQQLLLVASEIHKELLVLQMWFRFKRKNKVNTSIFSSPGFLTGGHVLRLFHGHMDECLAISTPEEGEEKRR